jgi:hypothetical protein
MIRTIALAIGIVAAIVAMAWPHAKTAAPRAAREPQKILFWGAPVITIVGRCAHPDDRATAGAEHDLELTSPATTLDPRPHATPGAATCRRASVPLT